MIKLEVKTKQNST